MASAHETPTETPIYGPGNIFDTVDDGPKDEIATLREANAALQRRLRQYNSASVVGEAVYVCMYTYVCMYVRMYVYTYVCMYVCMYVRIYVFMYSVQTLISPPQVHIHTHTL